jgi:hypothetical protein
MSRPKEDRIMRGLFFNLLLGFAVLQGAGLISGCSTNAASESEEDAASTGTFNLPLLTQAGGNTYRLQGYLWLEGPSYAYLDIGPESDVVSTTLPTGTYNAYLYGQRLERDDGTGTFRPVDARLTSSSVVRFEIFNQTTTTVSFEFETDGQVVTVGAGQLYVDVDVVETPPICELLGSDCASGTWCAPSELTARPLACISEGSVAEGEPCRSPLDCGANTSCFDFGSGPVCTRLCLQSEFEQACASGGICTPQGLEYGVCTPTMP